MILFLVLAVVYNLEKIVFLGIGLSIQLYPLLIVFMLSFYTIGHRIEMLTFLLNRDDNIDVAKKRYRSAQSN